MIWEPREKLGGSCYIYGRTGCLEENTEIYIFENEKLVKRKIKELPQKFETLSYDFNKKGKGKIVKSNAKKNYSGEKELFEIEFNNGTKILASSEHKFFNKFGSEILVKDLKKGMILFKKNCWFIGENNVSKRNNVKQKISKNLLGERNGMYGKKHNEYHRIVMESEKVKEKIKLGLKKRFPDGQPEHSGTWKKGNIPWNKRIKQWSLMEHPKGMLGKKHSQESINKIKKSCIGINKGDKNPAKRMDVRIKIKEALKDVVFKKKDTIIEIKIQNFLEELKIEYFKHKYIKEIEHGYQCDIFIPSLNLVIECDGTYWHSYPTGNEIDHIRTKELLEKGFKVLRLWEFEIKEMTTKGFEERLKNV